MVAPARRGARRHTPDATAPRLWDAHNKSRSGMPLRVFKQLTEHIVR